ncbi:MAG: hypothetical protein GX676_00030 [Bacilli bacterium]|nr:hypothetical protein [Bacilli bacterium]
MNDKQVSINRIRMPHMFRKSNTDIIDNDVSIDLHLKKITRSFRVNLSDQNNGANSYIDCIKNYERLVKMNSLAPLETKLLELRQTLIKEIPHVEETVEEVENMEVVTETVTEEIVETNEDINIDEIIKTTEQEIFSAKDQRAVLMNLIEDINMNSKKTQYDDSKFEQNIQEIIKETQEEDEPQMELAEYEVETHPAEEVIVQNNPQTSDTKPSKLKKSYKLSPVIAILIIIVLGVVAIYVNRDAILEFLRNL